MEAKEQEAAQQPSAKDLATLDSVMVGVLNSMNDRHISEMVLLSMLVKNCSVWRIQNCSVEISTICS